MAAILASILLQVAGVHAQIPPPELIVSTDRQTATVGDPIAFVLTVRFDSTLRLGVPPPAAMLGQFDVLGDTVESEGALRDGRREYKRRWRLAAFKTGDLWIPSINGVLTDKSGATRAWRADSLAVTITSVLAGSADTTDIRGLKGPYVAGQHAWFWWLAGALIVLLFAATWWWERRRRRRAAVLTVPPVPPWETALAALAALHEEVDPDQDGARLWYFHLSEILRRYWDGRYGWQSIDQTTTEIAAILNEAPFNGTHRQRAREFLDLADQVRYARLPARLGRAMVDWEWVRAFVNETIPRVPPAATGNEPEVGQVPATHGS
ncbi:MAG: DUF4381 family protein [Candidatus Zixiibacteriota bacterium]